MAHRTVHARVEGTYFLVTVDDHDVTVQVDGASESLSFDTRYLGHGRVALGEAGRRRIAWVVEDEDRRWVHCDGEVTVVELPRSPVSLRRRRAAETAHEALSAPMPATVVQVLAAPGTRVERGAVVVLLEAMKMELPLRAPHDAIVTAVYCREGELVQPGSSLVELEESPPST